MARGEFGPIASATDYLDRLIRTVIIVEHAVLGKDVIPDAGYVASTLQERIYPMLLEWSALPFLPPAELLGLFDRYTVNAVVRIVRSEPYLQEDPLIAEYFGISLQANDGFPLAQLLDVELEGYAQLPVRQAIRARALAVACPSSSLDGSYIGSIGELRALIKGAGHVRMAYYRAIQTLGDTGTPRVLFGGLDRQWMKDQVGSWDSKGIRTFLGGRLRPTELHKEQLKAGVGNAMQSLIATLKAVVEIKSPKLDTTEALLEAIRARPSGHFEEAVLRRVLPIVAVEEPAWAAQELPTGGYHDISTRGTFDRLLISNLAYPDDEFTRRFVEGELLYYELEAPPVRQPPKQYVLLDGSPQTWGIPRLAGGAVALSVVNRARERRAEALVLGAGRKDQPFLDLDRVSGIHAVLDHQRWEEDLGADLDAVADRIRKETKGHPTGSDLFVCTETARLSMIHEWATSSELPPGTRLHVFASDAVNGKAALWRRESGAFVVIATLSLAAKDLMPEGRPAVPAGPIAPPAPISPTTLQVNWDWAGDVVCAAIRSDGMAVTGHENGEIHFWDATRGIHLEHRHTFPHRVVSIALSGGHVVGVLAKPTPLQGVPSFMFRFAIRGHAIEPVAPQPEYPRKAIVRSGWLPSQFFWWASHEQLIEYRADENRATPTSNCPKSPHQHFLVSTDERKLFWKKPDGKVLSFDLKELKHTKYHPAWNALQQGARHLAIDADGRIAVRMKSDEVNAEVLWLASEASTTYGNAHLPKSQHPKAVSSATDRLLCSNTDSVWFWMLSQGKLIKQIVSPRQHVTALRFGRTRDSEALNAILVEFPDRCGLLLHWHPEAGRPEESIEVDPMKDLSNGTFYSQLHGSRGTFIPGTGWKVNPRLGNFIVNWNSRRIDFISKKTGQPRLRFWFRKEELPEWILASPDFVAGNSLGSLVVPEGFRPLTDPKRLAKMLALGVSGDE